MHILIFFIKTTEGLNLWLTQWKITSSRHKTEITIFAIKQYIISMVSDRMKRAILCPDGSAGHTGGAGISPEHFHFWSSWEWVILVWGFFFKFKTSEYREYRNNFNRKHKMLKKKKSCWISYFTVFCSRRYFILNFSNALHHWREIRSAKLYQFSSLLCANL